MTIFPGLLLAVNFVPTQAQTHTNQPDFVDLIFRSRWSELDQALKKINSFPKSQFKDYGETVIGSLCTFSGRSDMTGNVLTGMRLLYEHGANPSGNHGAAMLQASRLDRWGEVTERLIKYGVNPNAKCSMNPVFEGLVPIYLTAEYNNSTKAAVVLLSKGADPNVFTINPENPTSDKGQLTPLMIATFKNKTEMIKTLVKFKAKVNLTSPSSGMTALHYAAKSNASESITALLKAGANKKLKDKKGRTPLDIAKLAKAKLAVSLLK
ncbi:MAG: ankyrin repeat domain-containing protein [Armatimonadota bacterium]